MAYTKADKIKAITWYRDNGKNCIKTASKFGMGTATINRWLKCHPEILNAPQNESVIAKIEHGRAGNILRFEEKQTHLTEKVCELAYNRLIELIPEEKNIYNLVTIIEKLNPAKLNQSNKGKDNNESKSKLDEILESYNKKWQEAKQVIDII